MNELNRASTLRPEELDARKYLQSLTEQALRHGLMTAREFETLEEGLAALLAGQADRLNGGKSSSIRVEQAQELLSGLLFTLSLPLKACASPDEALNLLRTEPLATLRTQGLERIRRRLSVCRLMQQRLLTALFRTRNRFYRLTVEGGINGFFRLYRPQLFPQEIHITADYPPLLGRPALDGVEFIEAYLREIEAENAILCRFDPEEAHRLLLSLSREYADSPINLLEPVLLSALGLALLGKNPWRLCLNADDQARLQAMLSPLSLSETCDRLAQALARLQADLPAHAYAYATRCLPLLARHVHAALREGLPARVFPIPSGVESEAALLLSYGERMPNDDYRRLLDELSGLTGEARVQRTLSGVRSLADFIDLLADLPWRREEIERLVDCLPAADFLALTHLYPDASLLERPAERLLHEALTARRDALPPEDRRRFDAALARIRD